MARNANQGVGKLAHREMAGAVQKAYIAVRDRIVRGVYPPAGRITEQEISDIAGVSRTPAREALRRLHAEGFVRLAPNHGAVAAVWSETDIEDIFDLRVLLEPYGAARAASRITPEGIAELKRLANEQHRESVRRGKGYLQRVGALNGHFHRTLHLFAENPRLSAALPTLVEAPLVLHNFGRYSADDLVRSAMHHLEIVSALEARDGEWAAAVTRTHLLAARAALRLESPVAHGASQDADEP